MKSAAELTDPQVRKAYVEEALRRHQSLTAERAHAEHENEPGRNDGLRGNDEPEACNLNEWLANASWA